MRCVNKCKEFKAQKPGGGPRYANGQKYCSHCVVFMYYDGVRCPCCNYNLKYKAKNQKYKTDVKRI